jgi:CRP-like cAMP-binding protein
MKSLRLLLVSEHETIFSKGDEADSMFIIEYGKVKVEIENPVYLVAGDYFGEMGLLGMHLEMQLLPQRMIQNCLN